jgi:hypothetical protein
MTDHDLLWLQPNWCGHAQAWIYTALEQRGIAVQGAIEQPHVRPWSTVLRVPTAEGTMFFKATAPALVHEAGLTAALAHWRPDCTPAVLAFDAVRGWLLMRGAGEPLRTRIRGARDISRLRAAMPLYAGLQIDMAKHHDELLALGAFDRRLQVLPDLYRRLLDDRAALMIDQPDGLTSAAYERALALAPRMPAFCDELASYGLPETLHHDDFHDGNIFERDGQIIFADWGESCVAHPFFSMVVALRSVAFSLDLADDAPELERLRAAYLEPWTRFAPRERLLAAMQLAQWLGMLCRALTWHHVVAALEGNARAEYAEAVPGWLQEFVDAAPV